MTTITRTIVDVDGVGVSGVDVELRRIDATSGVVESDSATTDGSGVWSLDVTPCEADQVWEVVEADGGERSERFPFRWLLWVPLDTDTLDVEDVAVQHPEVMGEAGAWVPVGGGGGEPTADAHIGDTVDAHDASAISFDPAGDVEADNVQAAIEELDAEKADVGHTHPGSDGVFSFVWQGDLTALPSRAFRADRDGEVDHVFVETADAPSGTLTMDVLLEGTSLFVTAANPTVGTGNEVGSDAAPDANSFSAHDAFVVDVIDDGGVTDQVKVHVVCVEA